MNLNKQQLIANVATAGFVVGNTAYRVSPVTGQWEKRVLNAGKKPAFLKKKEDEEDDDDDDDDDDDTENAGSTKAEGSNADVIGEDGPGVASGGYDTAGNEDEFEGKVKFKPKGPAMNRRQMLASLDPEMREMFQEGLNLREQERTRLISNLTCNAVNAAHKDRLTKRFDKMTTNELRDLAAASPTNNVANDELRMQPIFMGASAPTDNAAYDQGLGDDPLPLPRMTFSKNGDHDD